MDKIKLFRQHLKAILAEYSKFYPSTEQKRTVIIADEVQDMYMFMRIGWSRGYRVHNCMFHADIREGKIWIEADWTEYSIAQELMDRKVSPSDIILAYYPKEEREMTEFAVE